MRTFVRRARLPACLVLVAGCASWQSSFDDPRHSVTAGPGRPVRVLLSATRSLTFDSAHVLGDSLIGFRAAGRQTLALSDVRGIEYRRSETGRGVASIAAMVIAVPIVVWALAAFAVSDTF